MKHEDNIKIFMPDAEGVWRESGDSETLHSFCERYEIEIPDSAEFMRYRNEYGVFWIYQMAMMTKIKIIELYE